MTLLDLIGLVIGLAYLYFEYRADRWVWLLSIIMPINSMIIYYGKDLYADFCINIYYLVIAVYGFCKWSRRTTASDGVKSTIPITHTPPRMYLYITIATCALWALIWWVLVAFTDSKVPVADAFTTALSIVASWMMARKYAEQWLVWLVADAAYVGLYIYKDLIFLPILYGIYTVIAWFGYQKWSRESVR